MRPELPYPFIFTFILCTEVLSACGWQWPSSKILQQRSDFCRRPGARVLALGSKQSLVFCSRFSFVPFFMFYFSSSHPISLFTAAILLLPLVTLSSLPTRFLRRNFTLSFYSFYCEEYKHAKRQHVFDAVTHFLDLVLQIFSFFYLEGGAPLFSFIM